MKSHPKAHDMESSRVSDFIRQYVPVRDPELRRLRDKAEEDKVPVIREEAEAFLKTVIELIKPHRILELGTAVGYSAISMLKMAGDDCIIDTIEDWGPRISEARANISDAKAKDRIHLIEGDALFKMSELRESYDLIFIDAAKAQYPDYLKEAMRLTHPGSVIIADNIFQDGEIMESKYIVERRDRTIHKRIREFLDTASGDDRLETSLIPLGDGLLFSVRRR